MNWGRLERTLSDGTETGLLDPSVEVERQMRKYLLGTTALVAASAMATSAMAMPIQSMSETGVPILTASMVAQWEAGIASNDNNAASANTRDSGFVNGRFAEIFFNGELTADNGLVYGARVHFASSGQFGNGSVQSNGFPGRQYIYLSGGWGSMEFGNWIGADSGLNLCLVCNTYAGYGALDTPWKSYIINPDGNFRNGGVNSMWFDQSVKITYYTPVVAGIQAGVSYTPTLKPFWGVTSDSPFQDNDGFRKDVFGFGLQFNQEFEGVGIALSAVGAVSDSQGTPTTSVNRIGEVTGVGYYELGARVRSAGFQFGGSWWDEGTGGAIRGRDYGFEKTGWSLEAAYSSGPYGVEVQYASTESSTANRTIGMFPIDVSPSTLTENYDVEMWSVSFGYAVAPGLKWYAEVTGADFDHSQSAADIKANGAINLDNDAVALITGLVLSF